MGSSSPVDSPSIHIDVDDRQQAHPVATNKLAALLDATIAAQHQAMGIPPGDIEVGLAFIDTTEMTTLNVEHMNGTGPTDVLAFPIDGMATNAVPSDQPRLLGDIVVCPEVAALAPQALADELALLVVHGALHLLGHDHAEPDETAVMKALEVDILDRFYAQ